VSSNFLPSQTSDFAGSTLEGTLPSATPAVPQGFNGTDYAGGMGDQLSAALGGLGQYQQMMQQANAPQANLIDEVTITADGKFKAKGDQSALAEVFSQMNDLKTMKAAAMARVAQLRQQEASGSPILDALSQFAGGMAANDPTMPGWVRALGATNLQMGNQGIKRERMVEENRVLQLGQTQAQMARVLMEDQRAERQMGLQEKSFEAAQETKKAALVESRVKDVLGRYKDEVDKGRPVDPILIATELVEGGLSKERAIAAATQMQKQAEINKAEIEAVRAAEFKDKAGFEAYKANLALRNDLTVQGRKEAEKMAELNFSRQTELEKIAETAKTKGKTDKKLGAAQRETLTQINVLEEKLDSLAKRAEKYRGTMGIVMGRVGNVMQNLPGASESQWAAERKAIAAELQRNVAQYVRAVQGGGNTISNKDVENAAKALPTLNMTYPQFVALVESVKDEGQYQRNAIKAAYEGDWEGKDRSLLGSRQDDVSLAKSAKVGSIVTINGAQYRKVGDNDYEPVSR
jgi:hypothetical protein